MRICLEVMQKIYLFVFKFGDKCNGILVVCAHVLLRSYVSLSDIRKQTRYVWDGTSKPQVCLSNANSFNSTQSEVQGHTGSFFGKLGSQEDAH